MFEPGYIKEEKKNDVLWNSYLKRLWDWYMDTGTFVVSKKEDEQLQTWTNTQRSLYKRGKIRTDRLMALSSIGFEWSAQITPWETSYNRLVAYKEKYGNCNVPYNFEDDLRLGQWAVEQRLYKKEGTLSAERVEMLNGIGFVWSIRNSKKVKAA